MTNETPKTEQKPKQIPSYYLFEEVKPGEKLNKPVGAAFAHKNGRGHSLLINGKRYALFPAKPKKEKTTAETVTAPAPGEGA